MSLSCARLPAWLFARSATARVALAWRIFFAHSGWHAREILASAHPPASPSSSPRLDSSAGGRTNGRWESQAPSPSSSAITAVSESSSVARAGERPSARSERATAQRLLLPSSPSHSSPSSISFTLPHIDIMPVIQRTAVRAASRTALRARQNAAALSTVARAAVNASSSVRAAAPKVAIAAVKPAVQGKSSADTSTNHAHARTHIIGVHSASSRTRSSCGVEEGKKAASRTDMLPPIHPKIPLR